MSAPQLLSDAQLAELRAQYETIAAVDPCKPTYSVLCRFLDRMPQELLKQLADARIKFLSPLARNRVKREVT